MDTPSKEITFAEGITLTDYPAVAIEVDAAALPREERSGVDIVLPFRDNRDAGCYFRLVFRDGPTVLYTSETYYRPAGILLSYYARKLLAAAFPKGSWPTTPKAEAVQ